MRLFETRAAFRSGTMPKHEYIQAMHAVHSSLYEYAEFIRETDISHIEVVDGTVVMTSRSTGVRMYCGPEDKRIPPVEALNFGQYERPEMDMVLRMVTPGFTVFDIGANIGWYTLTIARIVPDVKVMAFEPIPQTFGYLARNVKLNQATNVQIHNFGFSNQEKELTFYFCPDSSASASAANIGERGDAQLIRCAVRRLDDFVAEQGARIDFIKCDVEGAELSVFQGGMTVIERQRPIILSEMLRKWSAKFNYSPNDIIELLAGVGYKCYVIKNERLIEFARMEETTVETNFFFLDPDRHAAQIRELVSS